MWAIRGSRLNINELARRLNLSISTVSRALNDAPDVSRETRERVHTRPGETLTLSPDPTKVHLFDQQTGHRLN